MQLTSNKKGPAVFRNHIKQKRGATLNTVQAANAKEISHFVGKSWKWQ